jgi:hypothetical protein
MAVPEEWFMSMIKVARSFILGALLLVSVTAASCSSGVGGGEDGGRCSTICKCVCGSDSKCASECTEDCVTYPTECHDCTLNQGCENLKGIQSAPPACTAVCS